MDISKKLRLLAEGYSIEDINTEPFESVREIHESEHSLFFESASLDIDFLTEATIGIINESALSIIKDKISKFIDWILEKIGNIMKWIKEKVSKENKVNVAIIKEKLTSGGMDEVFRSKISFSMYEKVYNSTPSMLEAANGVINVLEKGMKQFKSGASDPHVTLKMVADNFGGLGGFLKNVIGRSSLTPDEITSDILEHITKSVNKLDGLSEYYLGKLRHYTLTESNDKMVQNMIKIVEDKHFEQMIELYEMYSRSAREWQRIADKMLIDLINHKGYDSIMRGNLQRVISQFIAFLSAIANILNRMTRLQNDLETECKKALETIDRVAKYRT